MAPLVHPALAFAVACGNFAALKFWLAFIHGRFPYAILAGVVWALAFPNPGIAGFAWLAPALICLSAAGQRGWAAWRNGFISGLTFHLIGLHWLLFIPVTGAPILGWVALCAFLALYPATWVWLCWKFFPAGHAGPETGVPGIRSVEWHALAASLQAAPWLRRMTWALACAVAWVALELVQSRLLTGMPWNLLGVSQYRLTPLIQMASVTGVYGVSFLVAWFSLSLLCVAAAVLGKPAMRTAWLPEIIVPLVAVFAAFGIGFRQTSAPAPAKNVLKVLLIQPAIPQTMIWDGRESSNRFTALLRLTQQTLTNQPDIVIWPEAAVPQLLRFHAPTAQAVSDLARTNHVWLILQADDAAPRVSAPGTDEADYFNAAFLLNPEGELAGSYRKQRLVMFGEYIPFVRWLPFLKWLAPIENFQAGDGPKPFALPTLGARTSVLICFEDMFPQSARAAVDGDTDFLVNLTNDGWFKEGAEQWQHAAASVFRAVENRVPLIRCTNNGLTCWIDEYGRIREMLDSTARGIYGEGFLACTIEFAGREARGPATIYRRHGDWFAWLCVALAAARLAAGLKPRRSP